MEIKYYTETNKLAQSEEHAFVARIKRNDVVDQETLINTMAGWNTTLTRQDIISVLDLFKEVVLHEVMQGNTVITDFFKTGLVVKGGFKTAKESFNKKKHKLHIKLNTNSQINKHLNNKVRMARILNQPRFPNIYEIRNLDQKEAVNHFRLGALMEIKGFELKNRFTTPGCF